jgi:hypothetical protein
VIKNKWSSGWTKSWFYSRVPYQWSFEGGKSMHALHSRMSELDYAIEPKAECPNNDPNDAIFIRATGTISGRDAVQEYVACKMYPSVASFGFESVPLRTTPMLRVGTPLPLFAVGNIAVEHIDRVLAEKRWRPRRCWGASGRKNTMPSDW